VQGPTDLTSQWAGCKVNVIFKEFTAYYNATNYVETVVRGVAINSLEIILFLQPARSDVKIGLTRAHGNRRLASIIFIELRLNTFVVFFPSSSFSCSFALCDIFV